jgi:PilZ domain
LKRSVIRVVCTSTPEMDRRRDVRYPVSLTCRVTVDGRGPQPATVADLSKGGALITGGPALPMGGRGTLGADGEKLHVAFDRDAATITRLAKCRNTWPCNAQPDWY